MAYASPKTALASVALIAIGALSAHCSSSTPSVDATPPHDKDAGGTTTGDGSVVAPVDSGPPGPCDVPGALKAQTLRAFVATIPHGTMFTPLTADQTTNASAASHALLAGDFAGAKTAASAIGYAVVPLKTSTDCLMILQPTATAPAGQGIVVARATYARDLILEAPHIPFDGNTDIETALVFDAVKARAAVFSGAQRCAVLTSSGCGKNDACNAMTLAPAVSDPSHSIDTAFHAFHLGIGVSPATSVIMQFHSNIHPMDNGNAMVTNGTRTPFPGGGSLAQSFYNALLAEAGGDIRTCNGTTVPVPAALCGETSTQGHATNGATDACMGTPPTHASDLFIHVEQNDKVMDGVDTWAVHIANAITKVIPAK